MLIRSLGAHASQFLHPRSLAPLSTVISPYSTSAQDWLAQFTNYEQKGVPAAAGTDSADGFDLGRVHRLLAALGSPHTAWPAVHVAGTKGKGSTVSMISSILRESGYRVGSYTSPHVVSMHERIAVNGLSISDDELNALVAQHGAAVEAAQRNEGGSLSHFEILTALAFRHFADAAVDVAVIETGLGGARDATNVLPADTLAAAVITAVGHDHADALGGTIEAIATSKAGIMKSKRPVVIGRQPDAAAAVVLDQQAGKLGCPVRYATEEVTWNTPGEIRVVQQGVEGNNQPQIFQSSCLNLSTWASEFLCGQNNQQSVRGGGGGTNELIVRLGLIGSHQLDNAAAAIATAAVLKENASSFSSALFSNIDAESVARGLQNAHVPGRFQLRRVEGNQGNMVAVLDGAHTPESAAALVATLRAAFPSAPVALVLAMASDKDLRGVCTQLRGLKPHVAVFTEVPVAGGNARSAAPGALVAAWQAAGMLAPRALGPTVRTRELIQASLKAAVSKAAAELQAQQAMNSSTVRSNSNGSSSDDQPQGGLVVVTGSLHAVAAALKDL